MGDAIKWKVNSPDFNNPYQAPISDIALVRLIQNEAERLKTCDLRCLVDGYEVMAIKNLHSPILHTSHPCISAMPRKQIYGFLKLPELVELVQTELQKLLEGAQEELKRREIRAAKEGSGASGAARKKKKSEGAVKKEEFRIMRM